MDAIMRQSRSNSRTAEGPPKAALSRILDFERL
jgi:hypothetical protein